MKDFSYYLEKEDVKKISADVELAKSLKKKAIERARFVSSLKLDEKSATIIFENIYEAFREAIDAILALNGYKSYSHEASIIFLKRFKQFSDMDINKLDNYRRKRNGSKYYGKEILQEEAKDILLSYNKIMPRIMELIKI